MIASSLNRLLFISFCSFFPSKTSLFNCPLFRGQASGTNNPKGLNNLGLIVGYKNNQAGNTEAWSWQNGNFATLPVPFAGDYGSFAYAVNDSGLVVGMFNEQYNKGHACAWQKRDFTYDFRNLPVPQGALESAAYKVNASGLIVGFYRDSNQRTHACTWQDGILTDLPVPQNITYSMATDVSDSGVILGRFNDGAYTQFCIWQNGMFIPLAGDPAFPNNMHLPVKVHVLSTTQAWLWDGLGMLLVNNKLVLGKMGY